MQLTTRRASLAPLPGCRSTATRSNPGLAGVTTELQATVIAGLDGSVPLSGAFTNLLDVPQLPGPRTEVGSRAAVRTPSGVRAAVRCIPRSGFTDR